MAVTSSQQSTRQRDRVASNQGGADWRDARYQAFALLRIAFTVAPIALGVDKFLNVLVDWPTCLAPWINDIAPGSGQDAGLAATPAAVEATGRVWRSILEVADRQDAATIVMGSRGLGGMHARVAGSVSSAVVRHSARPALVVTAVSPARIGR